MHKEIVCASMDNHIYENLNFAQEEIKRDKQIKPNKSYIQSKIVSRRLRESRRSRYPYYRSDDVVIYCFMALLKTNTNCPNSYLRTDISAF